ncbi:hypothetical protein GC163_23030 [bacterium]|nr:hypothetical protein [bacterium]
MATEPARPNQPLPEVLDQMALNHLAAIDATRVRLSEIGTSQGQTVGREDLGQMASPATPNTVAKDLMHRYGRESPPTPERTPDKEPDR